MRISILNAEGMDLTDAISEYAQKKVNMLDKYVDENDESAYVDVQVGKTTNHHHKAPDLFFCEFNVHVAGKYLNLKMEDADLYAAIDKAKDEMGERLRKYKDKQQSLVKRGGAKLKSMLRFGRK